MNTRLQTRLAEWEVLKIISDAAEAVACMHYLKPPLLHRDLKIENVLISNDGCYKLCDFGSCTEPRAAATNAQERRALEEDIQKNTTIQYRSPEMVDVSRRLPIDEKSDIWALGVLLYKLCYFTTPFEAQGQLAILNAAYTFPPFPPYTDRTKRLIAVTLQENPRDRPNIYQLVAEICAMRNVPVPITDIYKRKSEAKRSTSQPPLDVLKYEEEHMPQSSTPPTLEASNMRRGRPERSISPNKAGLNRVEPVKAYKSTPVTPKVVAEDEFTTKFPSLEDMDFALGPDTGSFAFASTDEKAPESAFRPLPKAPEPEERTIKPSEIKASQPVKPNPYKEPDTKPDRMEAYKVISRPRPLPSPKPNDINTRVRTALETTITKDLRPKSEEKPSSRDKRQTIHIDSSIDYLKRLDSSVTSTTSGSAEAEEEAAGPEREFRPPLNRPNSTLRRSVSVSSTHHKRPSLSQIPSFTAAKNIMNGKFGDAFRKFEKKTAPESRPLQVEEADLPDHITEHMRSSEAKRSSSYTRSRTSIDEEAPMSVKDTMRLLKEKANQSYVPQRSAQGYGKYTEPEMHRASTIIPTSRPEKPKVSDKDRRYALPLDDEDFTKRYPSVSDFKV